LADEAHLMREYRPSCPQRGKHKINRLQFAWDTFVLFSAQTLDRAKGSI